QSKQYQDALNTFSRIEQQFGMSEDISNEKVKLWLLLGKKDKAAEELQSLIESDPDEPRYYGLLIDFYMSNGMEDKAFDVLQKLVALDPSDPKADLMLGQFYRHKGEDDKAFEAYSKALINPDVDVNAGITVLLSYLPEFQNANSSNENVRTQAIELSK